MSQSRKRRRNRERKVQARRAELAGTRRSRKTLKTLDQMVRYNTGAFLILVGGLTLSQGFLPWTSSFTDRAGFVLVGVALLVLAFLHRRFLPVVR